MFPVMSLLADLPTITDGSHPPPGPLDVHLWRSDHLSSTGPARIGALLELLSVEERSRYARLSDLRRRRQFLLGRALCRTVLSRYAPVAPQEWQFAQGRRGKPFVAGPALPSPLWFNLSHTEGASVCAVTGVGPEIGIDIERIALGHDALEIAEQFFPEMEVNALRLLPPTQRGEAFVRIWALKESFVKARESSLADGIFSAAFDVSRPNRIVVTFGEPLHERAQEWQFNLFRLDSTRIIALAVHARTGPLRLRTGTCLTL